MILSVEHILWEILVVILQWLYPNNPYNIVCDILFCELKQFLLEYISLIIRRTFRGDLKVFRDPTECAKYGRKVEEHEY